MEIIHFTSNDDRHAYVLGQVKPTELKEYKPKKEPKKAEKKPAKKKKEE